MRVYPQVMALLLLCAPTANAQLVNAALSDATATMRHSAGDAQVPLQEQPLSPMRNATGTLSLLSTAPAATRADSAITIRESGMSTGQHVLLGAAVGVVAGIVMTLASVSSCEAHASPKEKGYCAFDILIVGPYATGGGAIVGGFVGWVVARSKATP
ncbi:hypothetical protein BH09GEM1_BH09GEM1_06760 [soil metagenome]